MTPVLRMRVRVRRKCTSYTPTRLWVCVKVNKHFQGNQPWFCDEQTSPMIQFHRSFSACKLCCYLAPQIVYSFSSHLLYIPSVHKKVLKSFRVSLLYLSCTELLRVHVNLLCTYSPHAKHESFILWIPSVVENDMDYVPVEFFLRLCSSVGRVA